MILSVIIPGTLGRAFHVTVTPCDRAGTSGSVDPSGVTDPAWQPTSTSKTPSKRMAQYVLQR
jgi:hypothetical protein